jgi:hypothetical protein
MLKPYLYFWRNLKADQGRNLGISSYRGQDQKGKNSSKSCSMELISIQPSALRVNECDRRTSDCATEMCAPINSWLQESDYDV